MSAISLLDASIQKINRTYVPGSLVHCQEKWPGLFTKLVKMEMVINQAIIYRDDELLIQALRKYEQVAAEIGRRMVGA